jgi:hypothetical protein
MKEDSNKEPKKREAAGKATNKKQDQTNSNETVMAVDDGEVAYGRQSAK